MILFFSPFTQGSYGCSPLNTIRKYHCGNFQLYRAKNIFLIFFYKKLSTRMNSVIILEVPLKQHLQQCTLVNVGIQVSHSYWFADTLDSPLQHPCKTGNVTHCMIVGLPKHNRTCLSLWHVFVFTTLNVLLLYFRITILSRSVISCHFWNGVCISITNP